MTKVYIAETKDSVQSAVDKILNKIKKEKGSLLKESGEVYLKVNGI